MDAGPGSLCDYNLFSDPFTIGLVWAASLWAAFANDLEAVTDAQHHLKEIYIQQQNIVL